MASWWGERVTHVRAVAAHRALGAVWASGRDSDPGVGGETRPQLGAVVGYLACDKPSTSERGERSTPADRERATAAVAAAAGARITRTPRVARRVSAHQTLATPGSRGSGV